MPSVVFVVLARSIASFTSVVTVVPVMVVLASSLMLAVTSEAVVDSLLRTVVIAMEVVSVTVLLNAAVEVMVSVIAAVVSVAIKPSAVVFMAIETSVAIKVELVGDVARIEYVTVGLLFVVSVAVVDFKVALTEVATRVLVVVVIAVL